MWPIQAGSAEVVKRRCAGPMLCAVVGRMRVKARRRTRSSRASRMRCYSAKVQLVDVVSSLARMEEEKHGVKVIVVTCWLLMIVKGTAMCCDNQFHMSVRF